MVARDHQLVELCHHECRRCRRVGTQRVGERERSAAERPPLQAVARHAREPEDDPSDRLAAEQRAAEVEAGNVLDGLGAEAVAVHLGGEDAVAQPAVARLAWPSVAPRGQLTDRRVPGQVDGQPEVLGSCDALQLVERRLGKRAEARIAGAQPELRRLPHTSPWRRRSPGREGSCRG